MMRSEVDSVTGWRASEDGDDCSLQTSSSCCALAIVLKSTVMGVVRLIEPSLDSVSAGCCFHVSCTLIWAG